MSAAEPQVGDFRIVIVAAVYLALAGATVAVLWRAAARAPLMDGDDR